MTVAEGVGHLVDVLSGRGLVEPSLGLLVQCLVHFTSRSVLLQVRIQRCLFEPDYILNISSDKKPIKSQFFFHNSLSVIVRFVLSKWVNGSLCFDQIGQWELFIWLKRNER